MHAGQLIHEFLPFEVDHFNASHIIHNLGFGVQYPGIVNPLDRRIKLLEKDQSGGHLLVLWGSLSSPPANVDVAAALDARATNAGAAASLDVVPKCIVNSLGACAATSMCTC